MTMTMFVDPPELSEFAARGDPPVNAWPGRTMGKVDIMKASGDPGDWFRFHHRLQESERATEPRTNVCVVCCVFGKHRNIIMREFRIRTCSQGVGPLAEPLCSSALVSRASGVTATAAATAALESASGLVARAFASAEVEASGPIQAVLTPELMAMIGRSLVRAGEIVFVIDTSSGRLELLPGQSYTVNGRAPRDSWRYEVTVAGPDRVRTYGRLPVEAVVHLTWGKAPGRPWAGIGPLQAAALAGKLSASTVNALAEEAGGPVGNLLPIPVDGQDDTVEELKGDLAGLKGRVSLVEGGDWDKAGAPRADWQPRRIGPALPESTVRLAELATREVLAACGVNPSLLASPQPGAAREAYRQFLVTLIQPLGKLAAAELSVKLAASVAFDWAELRAGDITGRARAFQSMVKGGMEPGRAAALAGLMVEE